MWNTGVEVRAHGLHVLRPFLVIGFLGGWTTYSTLAVDAVLLGKAGDLVTGLVYLAVTVLGGVALVVVGHGLGRQVTRS